MFDIKNENEKEQCKSCQHEKTCKYTDEYMTTYENVKIDVGNNMFTFKLLCEHYKQVQINIPNFRQGARA